MSLDVVNTNPYPMVGYKAYEETITSGTNEHNFWGDVSKRATSGRIVNDGLGDLTFAVLSNTTSQIHIGKTYGDEITLKSGEEFGLDGLELEKIRVTWVANTSYRIHLK